MNKRLLAIVLSLVLCVFCMVALAGCSDETTDTSSSTTEADETAEDNEASDSDDATYTYTAAGEQTVSSDTDLTLVSISSTGSDTNAVLVENDAILTLTKFIVDRTSDDSTGGDNASFYGVGATILVSDGTAYISDGTITSDSEGGAGVFAYDDGVIYISDVDITTQQDTSGGIHVAGGGTLYAWDLTVETNGTSSAAIRSDRGGGTMVVDGGTYTSNGSDSPAVYCTADIVINDATLVSNSAEAVCIEGLNSLKLFNCTLSGNLSDDSRNDCTWTVILYQSMSGDSEVGNSTFEMIGGELISNNGGIFYTTNTESTFVIEDVDITYADDCEFFLKCTGNDNSRGWGSAGSNGADCTFTAINQEMQGDIIWDSVSTLYFYMTDDSTLTGAIVDDESGAGSGGNGYCNVYIDSTSTWVVTGDSEVTYLSCSGTIVDEDGNTVTITGTDGTVYVEGDSEYTITVESYDTDGNVSGAASASDWSDYEVTKPEELD